MKPKICALISVRMKSSRLPNKALADIAGLTSLERVINNIKASKLIDDVIIATTTNKEDDEIENLAKSKGFKYFRGSVENIVERFLGAGKKYNSDIIVRVTGDCPLISYEIADYLIKKHLESDADYTSIEQGKLPIGTGSEIINYNALERLKKSNVDLAYSEYLTFYFTNNPKKFSINIVNCSNKNYIRPEYRMTLDYKEDLEFFRNIFYNLKMDEGALQLSKTIEYLDNNPDIAVINRDLELKWRDNKKLVNKLMEVTKIKKININKSVKY